jgi:hypothetical protein
MAEPNAVFHTAITASDDTSSTIEKLKERWRSLGHEIEHVGHASEHAEHAHAHMFAALSEHVDLVHEHFSGLHASIGEVGSSIGELIPQFGALAAAGAVVGLFETAEHVAERYGELSHMAAELGTSAQKLNQLQIVAKLTDTSVEGMDHSVSKLNKTLAEAASGKNKDAAALFKHLHLDPRQFKDGASALPALAAAFQHTSSATMRTRMAFALFGKAGAEMIPLLMKGRDALHENMEEAQRLGINFEPYGEGLERYNESQKKLTAATQGFTDLLGGKLAPVLQPLIDESTEFVLANREWITGSIAGGVREFGHYLENIPWKEVGDDIRTVSTDTSNLVEHLGGAKRVMELLGAAMALKGVMFLAEPIKEVAQLSLATGALIIKLGTQLVAAWVGVGNAAEAAGTKELAAATLATNAARGAPGAAVTEAEAAAGARASGFDRVQEQARRNLRGGPLTVDETTRQSIKGRGLASILELGFLAYDAQEGRAEDKDFIRNNPAFARQMTRAEYERLPEHTPHPVPWLGITDDKAHPGAIERAQNWFPHLDWFGNPASDDNLRFAAPPQAPPLSPGRAAQETAKTDITIKVLGLPGQSQVDTMTSGPVGKVDVKNLGEYWNPF